MLLLQANPLTNGNSEKVQVCVLPTVECEILIFIGVRRGMLKTKKRFLGLWNRSNIKSLLKDYDSKIYIYIYIKVIAYITNYGVDKSAFFFTIACSSYKPTHSLMETVRKFLCTSYSDD